jgi:hypothetical protein
MSKWIGHINYIDQLNNYPILLINIRLIHNIYVNIKDGDLINRPKILLLIQLCSLKYHIMFD